MRVLLCAAFLCVGTSGTEPGNERPFPIDRTQILSDEKEVYTVEGRVRIPRGVEITCQRDVHGRGTGSTPAVIEV